MLSAPSSTLGFLRTTFVAGVVRGTTWAAEAVVYLPRTVKYAIHAYRNRGVVLKMWQFDDRMLSDIGITRGDVGAALASDLTSDPTMRLRIMAVERRAGYRAQARERLEANRLAEIEAAARTAVGEAIAPEAACASPAAR
ncbi:MAG: DUF1127 domain-containing protein [Ancalomicrobiaceae bacterium]|nr:DUF1127 domain-containing protein [Ancalomicrobiaceae bacterium]